MSESRRSIDSEFIDWLQIKKHLKERSAKDVKSHLLRADKFINVDDNALKEPEITYTLAKSNEYQDLSSSTKSHLKRAVRLYQEYLKEKINSMNKRLF